MNHQTILTAKMLGAGSGSPPRSLRLRQLLSLARAVLAARRARVRERRRIRETAIALERLGERELRDIGLVRLIGVQPTRYVRKFEWE